MASALERANSTASVDSSGFSLRSSVSSLRAFQSRSIGWFRNLVGWKSGPQLDGLRKSAMEEALKSRSSSYNYEPEEKPWIDEHTEEVIWNVCRIRIYQFVHTKAMDLAMTTITIFNMILIIYETDEEARCYPEFAYKMTQCPTSTDQKAWLQIINVVILGVYTIEVILRSYAERCTYLESKMNLMELSICACDWVGQIFGSVVRLKWFRIFRVLRLARGMRFVKAIPELNALAMGFKGSMRAMVFGSGLLLLLLICCSILLVHFVHPVSSRLNFVDCERCSRGYESVMASSLTLFQSIIAGDSWGLISIPVIEEKWNVGILLPSSMLLIGVGAMNLILAVIVDKAVEAREKNKEHILKEKVRESHLRRKEMLHIFQEMDIDEDGTLDPREIQEALTKNRRFRQLLRLADVHTEDIMCILDILDHSHSGAIAYKDFCDILEHFQAADMRKVSVLTNMMISDLRRRQKDDHETCSFSSIRELLVNINLKLDKLDTVVDGYSKSLFHVNARNGHDGNRSEILEPSPKLQPAQYAMGLKVSPVHSECASDALQGLGVEVAELECSLLQGLNSCFQDIELSLRAVQQFYIKAALAAHAPQKHIVAYTPRSARSQLVGGMLIGGPSTPREGGFPRRTPRDGVSARLTPREGFSAGQQLSPRLSTPRRASAPKTSNSSLGTHLQNIHMPFAEDHPIGDIETDQLPQQLGATCIGNARES